MVEFELLARAVEETTGVEKDILISKTRKRPIVELRMICSNILKENHYKLSVEKVGKLLNSDHSTIVYHMKIHKNLLIQKNGKYKALYEQISRLYKNELSLLGENAKEQLLEKKVRLQKMIEDIDSMLEQIESGRERVYKKINHENSNNSFVHSNSDALLLREY